MRVRDCTNVQFALFLLGFWFGILQIGLSELSIEMFELVWKKAFDG